MTTYTVHTDAFLYDDFEADSLDDAIEIAFDGEIAGIVDVASLEKKFRRYVSDGGWCYVECGGERVIEIGNC